jgi:hypothetical protein
LQYKVLQHLLSAPLVAGVLQVLHTGVVCHPKFFEALQILKSMYCNGHIAAVHQAGEHVDALIATFKVELQLSQSQLGVIT